MSTIEDKKLQDPGFGAKYYKPSGRMINKDGSFNVRRSGASPFINAYQFLIDLNWIPFLSIVFLFFCLINLFFAGIYCALGAENFNGIRFDHFFTDSLFFSAQTLTTVGYGAISPVSILANFISSFEAFVGLLFFAMATGMLYGRFSKPNAKVKFSDKILVSPYQEGRALMFRVVNARNTQLSDMHCRVIYSFMEEQDGVYNRSYFNLKLERDTVMFFPLSWTLVHKLDEDSPFKPYSLEELHVKSMELMILMTGYDDTFNQTVNARYSYTSKEIVMNASFDRIFYTKEDGVVEVQVDKVGQYTQLEADG
jgi:inward rectifier potassium channel